MLLYHTVYWHCETLLQLHEQIPVLICLNKNKLGDIRIVIFKVCVGLGGGLGSEEKSFWYRSSVSLGELVYF